MIDLGRTLLSTNIYMCVRCSDNFVNIECINLAMGFEAQFEPKQEQKLKSDQIRIQYIPIS